MKSAAACVLTLAAALAAPLWAQAAPLSAYVAGPSISAIQLSGDGKMLAYATNNGDERHVIVQTVDDRKLVADVILDQEKIRDIRWAGPTQLLVLTLQDDNVAGLVRREKTLIQAIDLRSRKAIDLLRDNPKAANVVSGEPSVRIVDGKAKATVVAPYIDTLTMSMSVLEADLTTGRTRLVASNDSDVTDWQVDRSGQPIAQIRRGRDSLWSISTKRGVNWTAVMSGSGELPWFVGLTADGTSSVVSFPNDYGLAIRSVDHEGKTTDLLPGDDYMTVLRDAPLQRVFGAARIRDDAWDYRFINEADQRTWAAVTKAYPGAEVEWVCASDDRKRLVVKVTPPSEAPYFALVDLASGKSRTIGDLYPGLSAADIAPTKRIDLVASDGMHLSGFLTLPKNKAAKGLPLIVLPPLTLNSWSTGSYDPLDQALAARGYAVVRVNYRGLPMAGKQAALAGEGELGDKSLRDLSDAVKQLATAGTVDATKVCILGRGDLGGYAALASLVKDPGFYRCAVASGGMFNLKDWLTFSSEYDAGNWLRRFGVRRAGDAKLAAISPYQQAAKIKAPVMLIASAKDRSLNADWTRAMAKALRNTGGAVELFAPDGNNQTLALPSSQAALYQSILTFLEKNNPPN